MRPNLLFLSAASRLISIFLVFEVKEAVKTYIRLLLPRKEAMNTARIASQVFGMLRLSLPRLRHGVKNALLTMGSNQSVSSLDLMLVVLLPSICKSAEVFRKDPFLALFYFLFFINSLSVLRQLLFLCW